MEGISYKINIIGTITLPLEISCPHSPLLLWIAQGQTPIWRERCLFDLQAIVHPGWKPARKLEAETSGGQLRTGSHAIACSLSLLYNTKAPPTQVLTPPTTGKALPYQSLLQTLSPQIDLMDVIPQLGSQVTLCQVKQN